MNASACCIAALALALSLNPASAALAADPGCPTSWEAGDGTRCFYSEGYMQEVSGACVEACPAKAVRIKAL